MGVEYTNRRDKRYYIKSEVTYFPIMKYILVDEEKRMFITNVTGIKKHERIS